MAPSVSPLRNRHIRTLLVAAMAVAAVSLFLSPTGAFPSSGDHTLLSLSPQAGESARAIAPLALGASNAEPSRVSTTSAGSLPGALPSGKVPSGLDPTALKFPVPSSKSPTAFPAAARGAMATPGSPGHGAGASVRPPVSAGLLSAHVPAANSRQTSFLGDWYGINESMSGYYPPDPSVASGDGYVVEMTNGQIAIYDEFGDLIYNGSLGAWFGLGTDEVIFPRIIYDNLTDHWYAAVSDATTNTFAFAISDSSDPYGGWEAYDGWEAASNQYPWYPTIGVSEYMLGISLNDYNETTGTITSQQFVFNLTQIIAHATVDSYTWGNVWVADFVATDSITLSPDMYFALALNLAYETYTGFYDILNTSGAPPATPVQVESIMGFTGPMAVPENAAQYGTASVIDAGDGGIMSSYYQHGLVTSSYDTYYGTTETDIVRIDQAWPSNSTIWQDLGVYYGSLDLLYPAIGLDSRGDISVLTGFSSDEYYPGLIIFGQAWNEPYSVSYGGGILYESDNYTTQTFYGSYFSAAGDPTSSGVWAVGEYVNATGTWGTLVTEMQTDPVTAEVTAYPTVIDLGQPVVFNATAYGGVADYSFNWTSLPTGCTNSQSDNVSCTPSVAGTYEVSVNASDAYPTNSSASLSFTVNPLPTLGAVTASKHGADVGQTVTFTSATVVGGTPSYTYGWAGLPAGCGAPTGISVACTFTTAGTLSLVVTGTDAVGVAATSPTFSYTVSPALSVGTPTATPASLNTGASTTLAVTATGGSGSDTYVWAGLPTGCTSSSAASISCTPSATGTFTVTVTVTDSNGASATSAGVTVTVTKPASTGLFGLAGSTGYILIGVIVAVLVVLVLALLLRRKKPSPAPAAWQPGPPAGAAGGPPPGAGGSPPPPPPPGAQ